MKTIFYSILLSLFLFTSPAFAAKVQTLSIEELNGSLNDPNTYVLDVRTGSDWNNSKFKIKGAERASSRDFGVWSEKYSKDAKLILYCS